MRKIVSLILALTLVCSLGITAMAATFTTTSDKVIVEKGEDVTMTITLDADVSPATNLQLELYYNTDLFTYKSHTLASDYDFLTVTVSKRQPCIKINWFDQTSKGVTYKAGTIIEVVFTAKTDITDSHAYADFYLDNVSMMDNLGGHFDNVVVNPDPILVGHHDWDEGVVTQAATCTEAGVMTYTCTCGETKTEAIPALGHSYGEWTVTTAPTCTEAGVETRTCAACGETETRGIPATGHDYEDGTCPDCGAEDPNYQEPTTEPSEEPTTEPVEETTEAPTEAPTAAPTEEATDDATQATAEVTTEAASGSDDNGPKTGDNAQMMLWSVLVLAALAGTAVLTIGRKKWMNI